MLFVFQLLNHERSTILATTLQVAFLLFEAQREHLKFQMEQYITKLMDIVNLDSTKISYEQRELALGNFLTIFFSIQFKKLILKYNIKFCVHRGTRQVVEDSRTAR